ncbi:MAG: DUF2227 family putative metal-binding protein [Chloroflexaceae bacterium]|nr:DUF2227 family putative metal-binding protein [Chloroflexaceae bacterium]
MPLARTHDQIALVSGAVLLPLTTGLLLASGTTPIRAATGASALVITHLFCSYWLSPDLDISKAMQRRWGCLGFIWWPYRRLVPHRHWASHSGLSALIRLGYLALLLALMLVPAMLVLPDVGNRLVAGCLHLVQDYPIELGLVLVGAIVSDLMHTIPDHLSTSHKRKKRKRQQQRQQQQMPKQATPPTSEPSEQQPS